MIGAKVIIKRGSKEEAEKPFWISFSDLMSALMVLFLVVMSVALLAVTKHASQAEIAKVQREKEIAILLQKVQSAAKKFKGIQIEGHNVNFGDRARFDFGSSQLTIFQEKLLRSFVPEILNIANDSLGKKWFKRITVEGYTDKSGTYLYNLNLSLDRSQRVLCALMASPTQGENPLTNFEKEQIRDLFLVGGYSFNSAKSNPEASRRIELRLEFMGVGEHPDPGRNRQHGNFGACAI